jgi:hypothetical protein
MIPLRRLLRRLFALLVLWWLAGFVQLRRFVLAKGRPDDAPPTGPDPREVPCMPVPPSVYRRPDPTIYSQTWLMSQGVAVTWDNPDIHIELPGPPGPPGQPQPGTPVPSSDLAKDTDYEIVATIWNGSNTAPAVNLPVRFSYLDFGIGGVNVPLGWAKVNLPVNGAPGHPATVRHPWHTPATPGHYCIQVEPTWPDDANPANNLGQENTQVKALNSPHAAFTFPVRNEDERAQTLRLEVDAYELATIPCDDDTPAETTTMTPAEIERHRRDALERHGPRAARLPADWRVTVEPMEVELEPGATHDVTVDVTAPAGFAGRKAINVNALDARHLVGGVTLYVTGSGA